MPAAPWRPRAARRASAHTATHTHSAYVLFPQRQFRCHRTRAVVAHRSSVFCVQAPCVQTNRRRRRGRVRQSFAADRGGRDGTGGGGRDGDDDDDNDGDGDADRGAARATVAVVAVVAVVRRAGGGAVVGDWWAARRVRARADGW